MASFGQKFVLPDLPPVPHHPVESFVFPKRPFGRKSVVWRSCQGAWFKQWPFLHYDEVNDVGYCHICITAFKEKKMRSSSADPSFVSSSLYLLFIVATNTISLGF